MFQGDIDHVIFNAQSGDMLENVILNIWNEKLDGSNPSINNETSESFNCPNA